MASWGFTMPRSSDYVNLRVGMWQHDIPMDIMGNQWKTLCSRYFSSDMSDIFYVLEILIRESGNSEWLASSHHLSLIGPSPTPFSWLEQLSLVPLRRFVDAASTVKKNQAPWKVDSTAESTYDLPGEMIRTSGKRSGRIRGIFQRAICHDILQPSLPLRRPCLSICRSPSSQASLPRCASNGTRVTNSRSQTYELKFSGQ